MELERVIIRALCATVCIVVMTIAGCITHTNRLLANAPDPVAAACAMGASEKACMAYAGRASK